MIGSFAYFMIYMFVFVSLVCSFRLSRDRVLSAELFWAAIVLVVVAAYDMAAVTYTGKDTWIAIGVVVAVSARARMRGRTTSPWVVTDASRSVERA